MDKYGDDRLRAHLAACREGGEGFCSKETCLLFAEFLHYINELAPQLDQFTSKSHGGCDFRIGEKRGEVEGKNIIGVRFDAAGLKIRYMGTYGSPEYPRGSGKQHVVTDDASLKIMIDRLKMNKYEYIRWAEEKYPSAKRPSNY
ncbi:MAG: hypothetical protein HRU15_03900 [Planctomycetes bacterium]|nr:hypothetical protein [Planctomycetota bacterium]